MNTISASIEFFGGPCDGDVWSCDLIPGQPGYYYQERIEGRTHQYVGELDNDTARVRMNYLGVLGHGTTSRNT